LNTGGKKVTQRKNETLNCLYTGQYLQGNWIVKVDGQELDPRFDLVNHSPTGFSWGFAGSGPAQLALAILAHHYRDKDTLPPGDEAALSLYQRFKGIAVANFPQEGFEIDTNYVDLVIRKIHGHEQLGQAGFDYHMQKQESIVASFLDNMGELASEILEESRDD